MTTFWTIKIALGILIKGAVLPDELCRKDVHHKCHTVRIIIHRQLLTLIQGCWNKIIEETSL